MVYIGDPCATEGDVIDDWQCLPGTSPVGQATCTDGVWAGECLPDPTAYQLIIGIAIISIVLVGLYVASKN